MILVLIIGIPLFLWVIIAIEGFLGTFFNTLMTLFYLEIRKITPLKNKSTLDTPPAENIGPAV